PGRRAAASDGRRGHAPRSTAARAGAARRRGDRARSAAPRAGRPRRPAAVDFDAGASRGPGEFGARAHQRAQPQELAAGRRLLAAVGRTARAVDAALRPGAGFYAIAPTMGANLMQ